MTDCWLETRGTALEFCLAPQTQPHLDKTGQMVHLCVSPTSTHPGCGHGLRMFWRSPRKV